MQDQAKGIIYAAVTAFFWGFLAIALKVAVRVVEPATIVWFRFLVAFVLLALWQSVKEPESLKIIYRPPVMLVIAGVALSWNYLGFMFGIHYTSPNNAQLFIQMGPILFAIVGLTVFKEKIGKLQILGFVLVLSGLLLFYSQQLKTFIGTGGNYTKGVLLTLSGALAWAVYASFQKKLVSKYTPQTLNLFLFGLPILIYLPFINLQPLFHLHWGWWALLIFLGLNTLIAYSCVAAALKYTEANRVSMILILNPLITFTTMWVLTSLNVSWIAAENYTFLTVAGALTVLAGAALVVRGKRKAKN